MKPARHTAEHSPTRQVPVPGQLAWPQEDETTALLLAAARGCTEVVKLLLDRGADAGASDRVSHPLTVSAAPCLAAACDGYAFWGRCVARRGKNCCFCGAGQPCRGLVAVCRQWVSNPIQR